MNIIVVDFQFAIPINVRSLLKSLEMREIKNSLQSCIKRQYILSTQYLAQRPPRIFPQY